MRRAFATLLALLAGCGGGLSGRLSDDVNIAAVDIRIDSVAVVRGTLSDRGVLPDFIGALEDLDVSSVSVRAPMGDGLQEAFNSASFWLEVERPRGTESGASLEIALEGVHWAPEYSWTGGDSARVTASVSVFNGTGQSLVAETVSVLDRDGTVLARAAEAVIPAGRKTYPWWSSSGSMYGPYVRFGWPLPDRACAMMAFLPERPGPVTGMETRRGILPAYSRDTLWLPADDLIDLGQSVQQLPAGYGYTLTLTNLSSHPLEVGLRIPDRLPRGATIVDPRPPQTVLLQAGQSELLRLVYEYPR
jgi:hypothetical protein